MFYSGLIDNEIKHSYVKAIKADEGLNNKQFTKVIKNNPSIPLTIAAGECALNMFSKAGTCFSIDIKHSCCA